MDRKNYVIVMAAGQGSRMGGSVPKQFLDLGGKPILRRTIENFIAAVPGIRVVTVLPKEYVHSWREYCVNNDFIYPQLLVEGGLTRFHSVKNALERIPDGVVVAIQDAVRPLAGEKFLSSLFAKMGECRAVVPVVPCIDTLKSVRKIGLPDGSTRLEPSGELIDRSTVYCAQTPQIFLSEDIKDAYSQAFDLSFTDDASVAERKKIPLSYVEGERFNIKITTPEDLTFAEAILGMIR